MDAVADPIDQITPSGDIIFANKAYLKFYGKSGTERDEIIGANIFDLVPPEHVDIIREKIAGLSPENPIFEHKEEFTNEEGEEFHLFWRDQGLFDEEGNLTGIVAVGRDFTADKKAEAEIKWAQDALRRSEEQYRLVVESQSEMINQFRPDGEIIFLNSNYRNFIERVWGYHKVTTGINLFEVVDENTVLWIKREIDKLKTEEDRWEHEECIRDLDGIEIFVRWEIKALFDDEGRVTSFLSVGRDVTLERNAEEEVREAQEALRKSEEQHRLIMDGIPDMIDQVTPQGEITFSNKSRREFLRDAGVEEGGSVGENIFEQMSPEDAKQLRENFAKFDPEHPILQHEMISVGTDGQEYHLRWRNQALFDDDGKVSSIVGIGRDFTSGKRAEKEIARVQDALRRSEERNRLILDRAFAAVVSMDLEGKITAWNLRAEELFGWPKSEAIGRTVEETIIPRRYREGHREGLKLFRKTGEANVIGRVLELEALHRDGHEFPVDLAITHVELLSGGLFTAFILDISDRKEAEEALRQAKEEAEAATRAKSEFLANMSHEIRTPMNAILGFSELLERKIEDASLKHYLDSISSSGRTLLGLINDLLDLSKIEAGKLNIEWEPVNVTAVFEEIRNIFELRTKEKNLDLFLDIDSALPSWVLLDEVRVRQVLFNLVGNAIKFTHSGHVRLCVEKAYNEVDESKLDLSISVEDTGVGIKAEEQDRIFEEFAQQSGQSSRTFGGTGLGLSITKRLVHLMGGTIEVESEVGKGTTVKVVLKDLEVASVDVDARKTDDEDFEEVIFDPATVLIVEDKYLNRALVREFLENTGLTILEAENGLEGVEAAVRNHPDLILMDISMPVMNGREASKSIRENSEIGSTPIIVLTASGSSTFSVVHCGGDVEFTDGEVEHGD